MDSGPVLRAAVRLLPCDVGPWVSRSKEIGYDAPRPSMRACGAIDPRNKVS